jgi:hypothetical protein
VEGREEALSFAVEEELDDLRACAPGQHLMKLLERGANNLSPRGFRIASLAQNVNQAVDPFGVARVEADGSNPMPRA